MVTWVCVCLYTSVCLTRTRESGSQRRRRSETEREWEFLLRISAWHPPRCLRKRRAPRTLRMVHSRSRGRSASELFTVDFMNACMSVVTLYLCHVPPVPVLLKPRTVSCFLCVLAALFLCVRLFCGLLYYKFKWGFNACFPREFLHCFQVLSYVRVNLLEKAKAKYKPGVKFTL